MSDRWDDDIAKIEDMLGGVIVEYAKGDEQLTFTMSDGRVFRMYHDQNCYESVVLEDVCGDLDDLLYMPLLRAECVTSTDSDEDPFLDEPERVLAGIARIGQRQEDRDSDDSNTWTFYKLATNRGSVTLRWHGSSNGYYSESVTISVDTKGAVKS